MSLEYIRNTYGVPAKRGAEIVYFGDDDEGTPATIVGAKDGRLRVRFEGDRRIRSLHPKWCIEYVAPER